MVLSMEVWPLRQFLREPGWPFSEGPRSVLLLELKLPVSHSLPALVRKMKMTEDSIRSILLPLQVSKAERFSQQRMLREQSGGSLKKGNRTTDL